MWTTGVQGFDPSPKHRSSDVGWDHCEVQSSPLGEVVATVRVTGTETVAVLCQLIARATGAPCFAVWNRGVETAWNSFGTGESMVFRMEHPILNGWCGGISILGKSDLLNSGGLARIFTKQLSSSFCTALAIIDIISMNGNYGGTSPLLALPLFLLLKRSWRPWFGDTTRWRWPARGSFFLAALAGRLLKSHGDPRGEHLWGTRCTVARSRLLSIPSGKHTKSYWNWPFIVDLPSKNGDFP